MKLPIHVAISVLGGVAELESVVDDDGQHVEHRVTIHDHDVLDEEEAEGQ